MPLASSEVFKLVQFELRRARDLAEHAAECAEPGFLLYLIDMAILEAKRESRSSDADRERSAAEHSNGG